MPHDVHVVRLLWHVHRVVDRIGGDVLVRRRGAGEAALQRGDVLVDGGCGSGTGVSFGGITEMYRSRTNERIDQFKNEFKMQSMPFVNCQRFTSYYGMQFVDGISSTVNGMETNLLPVKPVELCFIQNTYI